MGGCEREGGDTLSTTPSAETLVSILNDPAIPGEAKAADYNDGAATCSGDMIAVPMRDWPGSMTMHRTLLDAVLYRNMSAWLWERGWHCVSGHPQYQEWKPCFNMFTQEVARANGATPVEALAAVVREAAAQMAKNEHLARTLNDTCVLAVRSGPDRDVNAASPSSSARA